jgi:hypothetical protein
MAGVMRFLFALLLGVLIGAAGMGYLLQSGAGDFFIRRTEAVQDLERRLADTEKQRDQAGRQLEDVVGRAARMEQAFSDLERRFRALEGAPSAPRSAPSELPTEAR